jgi:hypothetical protein
MRKRIIHALAASWLVILSSAAAAFDVIQITNNSTFDAYPAVSGSNVVWQGGDDPDGEIYLWDGATTTQLTNNTTYEWVPDISGSNVVWMRWDGSHYDIYLWEGGTTTNISNDSTRDEWPAISGSNVVWWGCDDSTDSGCSGSGYEIYLWNGLTTTQLTNNTTDDVSPAVSGSNVVWFGEDGSIDNDYEIYMTTITGPTPVPSISLGGLALLAGLVLGTAGRLIRRRRVAGA